jgi:2'-5' RNA ligase
MSAKTHSGNERLFVAASVTQQGLRTFRSWVCQLKAAINGHQPRWLPPENWHLTLKFIGSSDRRSAIKTALDQVVAGPPVTARAHSVGPFPNRRPSVLAVQLVADDQLLKLVADIERALRDCGLKPEPRPFRAHVSVARLKRGAKGNWPTIAVRGILSFEQVILYRSELTSSGARYTPLQRWNLTGKEKHDVD